ncbi:ribbon-helix-helix protein, CopG family [Paraburkholderia nemoris]
MERTHIFLPQPMRERLKVLSQRDGQTMAELIRSAILELLSKRAA